MIYFVDDVGPSPLAQNVVFRDLPLRDVGQHPLFLTIFLFLMVFSVDNLLIFSGTGGSLHDLVSGVICF